MDQLEVPLSQNNQLTEMLGRVLDVLKKDDKLQSMMVESEITHLLEFARDFVMSSENEAATTNPAQVFHVRAHRIHTLNASSMGKVASMIRNVTGNEIFAIEPHSSTNTFEFVHAICQDPVYRVVVAFLMAGEKILQEINEYRMIKFKSTNERTEESEKKLAIEIAQYYEEVIGAYGFMARFRIINLYKYYLSVFNTDPNKFIEVTVNPDGMCETCSVKAPGTNFGPHCVKDAASNEPTEDQLIIPQIVVEKAKYEQIIRFETTFGIKPDTLNDSSTDIDRMTFGLDYLYKGLKEFAPAQLYPEQWLEALVTRLTELGVYTAQQQIALNTLHDLGHLTNEEHGVYSEIAFNPPIRTQRLLTRQSSEAIMIVQADDDNTQFRAFVQLWLLFDKDFARSLDIMGVRYSR